MSEHSDEPNRQASAENEPQSPDVIPKNFLEQVREIDEAERKKRALQEQERQKHAVDAAYVQREEYSEKLAQEKLELIRLKQGLIDDSELIPAEPTEKKKYTLGQKIGNFFYHNKWWLGFGTFFAVMAVFLLVDFFNQEEPDIAILLLANDQELGTCNERIADYVSQFCGDLNGDGKVSVDVYFIPVSDKNAYANSASSSKLMVEYHSDTAMMVIADSGSAETIMPKETLTDLSPLFPDNPLVDNYAFDLTKTNFCEQVKCENLPQDLYLGIRAVQARSYATEEEMQKSFDRSYPVLQKLIADLTPENAD